MSAAMLWAAQGLTRIAAPSDALEPIFALSRAREPVLIEDSDRLFIPDPLLPHSEALAAA